MNLMVFESEEWGQNLPLTDHRGKHLKEILKLQIGDEIKMGLVGEKWGKGQYLGDENGFCRFIWPVRVFDAPPPYPLVLLIGTPRPPTARRLLKDLTTLGVASLHFTPTDLGEKSYLQSSLWTKNEYRENLLEGAQQGESTHLPEVHTHRNLHEALKALPAGGLRIAPDLPKHGLSQLTWPVTPPETVTIAVGPERGWTEKERIYLGENNFQTMNLGPRNLRTETASLTAVSLILSRYFW